jgi:hypothetical protein
MTIYKRVGCGQTAQLAGALLSVPQNSDLPAHGQVWTPSRSLVDVRYGSIPDLTGKIGKPGSGCVSASRIRAHSVTHQSVIKTTFLLYFPKAGATLEA